MLALGSAREYVVHGPQRPCGPSRKQKLPTRRDALIRLYQQISRTADDLPYTVEFEKLYDQYIAEHWTDLVEEVQWSAMYWSGTPSLET